MILFIYVSYIVKLFTIDIQSLNAKVKRRLQHLKRIICLQSSSLKDLVYKSAEKVSIMFGWPPTILTAISENCILNHLITS